MYILLYYKRPSPLSITFSNVEWETRKIIVRENNIKPTKATLLILRFSFSFFEEMRHIAWSQCEMGLEKKSALLVLLYICRSVDSYFLSFHVTFIILRYVYSSTRPWAFSYKGP